MSIDVFPATDEAFREQHGDDYKQYVRNVFEETNGYLKETFSDEAPNPHIVITTNENGEWGEWTNPGTNEDTGTDMLQMKRSLNWPLIERTGLDEENRRGADVLSGFSGRNLGDPLDENLQEFIESGFNAFINDLADVAAYPSERPNSAYDFAGGATLIGTNDQALDAPLDDRFDYPFNDVIIRAENNYPGSGNDDFVDNYYLHELGHVLGAQHPEDQPEIEKGTHGVMGYYSGQVLRVSEPRGKVPQGLRIMGTKSIDRFD